MKRLLISFSTGFTLLFCGCSYFDSPRFGLDREYPELNYTGDGNFTDYGRESAIHRFALDLGGVDLNDSLSRSYDLKGLPEVKFVCYLRVDHPLVVTGGPKGEFTGGETILEMKLIDHDGKSVFTESAPLNRWKWSGSVGAPKSDLYTSQTIFTPEKDKSYKITFKVIDGKVGAPKGRFLLMGGGWKANPPSSPSKHGAKTGEELKAEGN